MAFFAFLLAIIAGISNPFQSATNGELNKQLHHPVWAGISVYAAGLAALLLVQAIVREALPVKIAAVPWWAWTGGIISILSTMVGLTMVQKLGSGVFTGISLTAALVTSVLLDQFGVAGLRQHSASPGRMVGCGLLIAGIWLVARS